MSQGGEGRMIVRARSVVTMDGPPIENGAVAISGTRIVDVGKFPEVSARNSGETVDLGEQALLPGLINAHCHLDYTCLRGKIPKQKSFTDWIRGINAEKGRLAPEDYVASINEGFAEAKSFGTTTIANITAFPELISRIAPSIRTWWFAELINVRSPGQAKQTVDNAFESIKSVEHWGLAPHAPFTASAELYRACEVVSRRHRVPLTTHLAESAEEMLMFREAAGALYEFLKEIGRPMNDCGEQTPFGRFSEIVIDSSTPSHKATAWQATSLGMTDGWILVHLNELTESDLGLLRELSSPPSIVHCPRSHDYFEHSQFQFQNLRDLGCNICLGTDSLASNADLSLFAEMRAFQKGFGKIDPQEILEMVTVRPAWALGKPDTLGRVRPNYLADLIALPWSKTGDIFESIIAYDGPINWLMIGGTV
jgi:aminodeoxyfutalosine deaminase